ncbi:MAG: TIGR00725 family protein [Candidatus Omnitrophica bacterium]|nr:TIGR00725 family protein [Candidatus Omnitrophota bacterium]
MSREHAERKAKETDLSRRTLQIGVIGSGRSHPAWDHWAHDVGEGIAKSGAVLVCGGLSGVMAAAARAASRGGGVTVGILPGANADEADEGITIPVPTGLGEGRNLIVVQSSDALIAIGGGAGTLSEIGFAMKLHKPLVLLGSWQIHPPEGADPIRMPLAAKTPAEAVQMALHLAKEKVHH